jgi:hypothetical protein
MRLRQLRRQLMLPSELVIFRLVVPRRREDSPVGHRRLLQRVRRVLR